MEVGLEHKVGRKIRNLTLSAPHNLREAINYRPRHTHAP